MTATTFDGRLAEQARQRPDAPAVLFGGETCSYAELDGRVARMAGQLAGAGVGAAPTGWSSWPTTRPTTSPRRSRSGGPAACS